MDLLKTRMQVMPLGENKTFSWHVEEIYTKNGGYDYSNKNRASRFYGGMRAFWDGV
jgi:hypothetical protein